VALHRAWCRAAAFLLSVAGVGCSDSDGPSPQEWADGELKAVQAAQHNPTQLSFVLPSLKNELSMKQLNDAGVAALLAHPDLPQLESLHFSGVNITDATVRAVVASPKARDLEDLNFGFAPLGDAGLEALAAWPGLTSVKTLTFDETQASARGVKALAEGPHGQSLPALALNWQSVGDAGAEALAKATIRGRLSLKNSQIGGMGARALIERAPAPVIDLTENPLGTSGLVGLKAIGEGLEGLILSDCQLGERDIEALVLLTAPASFTSLSLGKGQYGDRGIRLLAKAPWLAQMEHLYVDADASDAAQEELRAAWGLRKGLGVGGIWSQEPRSIE